MRYLCTLLIFPLFSITFLHSIDDPISISLDLENLTPAIQKYSPVLYLHREEKYFPTSPEEYCTDPQTAIATQGSGSIVIPRGTVTMNAIYDLYINYKNEKKEPNLYFDINESVKYGSDPRKNSDSRGNLLTPCSVITWEKENTVYIQYLYLYSFNGQFKIGLIKDDVFPVQDAHEADLEHITLQLDKQTQKLQRIYYSSHGRREGVWLDANHQDISYEGSHPVVFVARSSHANYSREGTYVRIFGLANDFTNKGRRWTPAIRRIYTDDDKRFDPSTMGWCYHAGDLGKRGVSAPCYQGWFHNELNDIGRDYHTVLFCRHPDGDCLAEELVEDAEYRLCILSNIPFATIPD